MLWSDAWNEIENDPAFLKYRGNYKVLLVSESLARTRQISNGENRYMHVRRGGVLHAVELIRLTEIDECEEFKRAVNVRHRQATADITRGELLNRVWQERFRPHARNSREVVIIDRHAAARSLESRGLFNLLHLVNAEHEGLNKCSVTLYSACDPEGERQSPEELRASIEAELMNSNFKNIESVEVYLPHNHNFAPDSKDRFVRFDESVLAIGHGLEVFEGVGDLVRDQIQVPITTTFTHESYEGVSDRMRDRENGLKAAAESAKIQYTIVVEYPTTP